MQGTMYGSRVRERPHMTWMRNAKAYAGLLVGEVVRKVAEQNTWKTFAQHVDNPITNADNSTNSL